MELKPNVLTAIAIVALMLSAIGAGAGILALTTPGTEGPEGPAGETGDKGDPGFGFAGLVIAAYNSIDNQNADYVCDGTDDQEELNEAIAALPEQGGSIYLREGTYVLSGNVTVTRSDVQLKGAGSATKMVLEPSMNESICAFLIEDASNIKISDLSIEGKAMDGSEAPMRGTLLGNSTDCELSGLHINDMKTHGINTINSTDITIDANCISNCTLSAILLVGTDDALVIGNTLDGGVDSTLRLEQCQNSIVSNNIVSSSAWHGILLHYCEMNTVESNVVYASGSCGIYLDTSSRNVVSANQALESALYGIFVGFLSSHNTVTGNTVHGSGGNGISLDNSRGNVVNANLVTDSGWQGINLYICSAATVNGNTVETTGYSGISLSTCDSCLVTDNTVCDADQNGIRLSSSSDNVLRGNVVFGNSQNPSNSFSGIYLSSNSNHNLIDGNSVRMGTGTAKQRYGIYIAQLNCNVNVVINNDLYYAGLTADYIDDGTDTEFHNNLVRSGWVA